MRAHLNACTMVVLKTDPYEGRKEYRLKKQVPLFNPTTQNTCLLRSYETKISAISRLAKGVMALLATLLILPLIIKFTAVKILWKEALLGLASKTIRVVDTSLRENLAPREPRIRFSDENRARLFYKSDPAEKVGLIASITLSSGEGQSYTRL